MKTVKIRLSSIEAVRDFVEIVRKYDSEIDLSSGRYVVEIGRASCRERV